MNLTNIRESDDHFEILETTGRTQTAVMRLQPGEASDDGMSNHPHSDQVLLVVEGEVIAEIGDEKHALRAGDSVTVAAGVKHRFTNSGKNAALTFNVYGPPAYETGDPH